MVGIKGKSGTRYSAEFKSEVLKLIKKGNSVAEVSKGFGIDKNSTYNWLKRYEKEGEKGLERKTKSSGGGKSKKSQAVINKVIETKEKNPGMGAGKISGHLARFDFLKICSNTVRKILNKNAEKIASENNQPENPAGITEAAVGNHVLRRKKKIIKRNKPKQVRYFERSSPNTLWQMDIMTFMLKGQYRIYLIGIIDDYSRFIVSHGLYRRQTEANVMEVVRAGMEKYKSPKEILTDNGRQFYSWRGKSKFTKFCIKTGIQHIRSRPYHPQTLGKIESFWRNLYQEFLGETPLSSFEEAQAGIANWIRHYNYKRVHLGIGGLVPADRFFGVSNQVEKLMREGAEETEKALAENPDELKAPMYLVGKIGDREIRVVAKGGEIVIHDEKKALEKTGEKIVELGGEEKACIDGEQGVAEPLGPPEKEVTGQILKEFKEELSDGRRKEGEPGINSSPGYSAGEDGGQVPPDNQQPGEGGTGAECIEREENSGRSDGGSEYIEGRVLQVAETGDGRNEGEAGAGGPGQKSNNDTGGEGGEKAVGTGKAENIKGENASGGATADSAEADRMAGRREAG